jgi:hypothetical protein
MERGLVKVKLGIGEFLNLHKGVEGIIFIYGGSLKIKFLKNYATWLWLLFLCRPLL